MLLNDVLSEFIFDCKLRKLSERTIKEYRNNNAKMFQYLKSQHQIEKLSEVSHLHIKNYINYLVSLKKKESYINSLIKCFRAFFKYCVEEKYIENNPMSRVKFQKEPITLIETFSDKEVRSMIICCPEKDFKSLRDKLILIFLFDTGIRCQELCDLTLNDITDNSIKILGKGKKERHVPLTPTISKYLIKYLRLRNSYIIDKYQLDGQYLFLSVNCRKMTIGAVEKMLKDISLLANVRPDIRCSPHTCRHYYAQKQLKNGCDIYTLSRLLGHTNITITKRYLQSISDEKILELGVATTPLSGLL